MVIDLVGWYVRRRKKRFASAQREFGREGDALFPFSDLVKDEPWITLVPTFFFFYFSIFYFPWVCPPTVAENFLWDFMGVY